MGILDILYSIIINPLILVFDVVFSLVLTHLRYVGWSIVILSLIINTLVLPLYIKADELQAAESAKRLKLKKWEDKIKKAFKGDERFMMLQTFYRQNDYKPYHSLRGALPLFLEIPFFIAAYRYISSLQFIAGYSFGPIKNLAISDQMITIGGLGINVMPILMTVINIISSMIYNRSTSLRDKIQLFVVAGVFLVLLYNSPSGLVLYWTCNNIYSLCKNIVYRFFIKENKEKTVSIKKDNTKDFTRIFVGSSLILSFLVGSYIPSMLISDSVDDFISYYFMTNPFYYILNSLCMAVGLFFLWIGVYYYLARPLGKKILAIIMMTMCVVGFINYSTIPFETSMSMYLSLDSVSKPTSSVIFQSLGILLAVFALAYFAVKYKKNAVGHILLFTLVPFVIINCLSMGKVYNKASKTITMLEEHDDFPEIHLSKNGKNVVVIMMDRMIGYYVPYLMNEKPELYEKFEGFTFYPNSISYGTATNVGSPGLYGGYEYIPIESNKRTDVTLAEKQNEALCVMPVIFGENGYDVTVGDPSYANYCWIPDLSIYDNYPYIYKYNVGSKLDPDGLYYVYEDVIKRNLVCYGIYRSAPSFLQSFIYDNSSYNSVSVSVNSGIGLCFFHSLSTCEGISEFFFSSYNQLDNLDVISKIDDDDTNHFNMFSNNVTHEACLMVEPDYSLSPIVDNTAFDYENQVKESESGDVLDLYSSEFKGEEITWGSDSANRVSCYHSNMTTMLLLGKWFDYLREQGVYDNTKIIIVSDHSYPLGLDHDLTCDLTFESGGTYCFELLAAQSTLLVKDFDSKGFVTDDSFMTNADVPTLAFADLIDNPVNPFTGKDINSDYKNNGDQWINFTSSWKTEDNDGYTFKQSQWFSVHDNIFDVNNWKYEGAH